MDKGTWQVDRLRQPGSQRGSGARAIFVLGTPAKKDILGRMKVGISLLRSNRGEVIIALGNREEAGEMREVANRERLSPTEFILDENSRTTIDNAYLAKKICEKMNLIPSISSRPNTKIQGRL